MRAKWGVAKTNLQLKTAQLARSELAVDLAAARKATDEARAEGAVVSTALQEAERRIGTMEGIVVALENQVASAQKEKEAQAALVSEQQSALSSLRQQCADADLLTRARSEALVAEQRRTNEMTAALAQVCSQRDRLALEANLAEEEKAAATHRAHTLNTLLSRDRTELLEQRRLAEKSKEDYHRARTQLSDLKMWALAAPGISARSVDHQAHALAMPPSSLMMGLDAAAILTDTSAAAAANSPPQHHEPKHVA
jgi:hypothetical protein